MPFGNLANQLSSIVGQQMRGEGLGYSPEQRQQMWGQTQRDIERQTQRQTADHLQNMQSRGILSSDIAAEGMGRIARGQSEALAKAGTQMDLQDQQMRQQGIQQAMGLGSQLAQMSQRQHQADREYGLQRDQFDFNQEQADREYGFQQDQFDWQKEQFDRRFQQEKDMMSMQDRLRQEQQQRDKKGSFWQSVGQIGGTFLGSMAGPAGSAAGNRLGSFIGSLFDSGGGGSSSSSRSGSSGGNRSMY